MSPLRAPMGLLSDVRSALFASAFFASSLVLLANLGAQTVDPTVPPAGQKVLLTLTGRGVQIYTCKMPVGGVAGGPVWTFVAPEAKLEDANGAVAGQHGGGPTWTLSDGSSVHGKMIAQKPSEEAGSIPWLLLEAHDPTGALKAATYIRRSATHGGKPAATGCDPAHIGAESRIPYTATYTFYGTASQ